MKWEYLVVEIFGCSPQSQQDQLDAVGAEGWELIAVDQNCAYLKRALSSAP